ncbi:MAG: hypothetical protein M3Q79_03660, partial [bacterium]|nr:hypothetical protein [bacterium]
MDNFKRHKPVKSGNASPVDGFIKAPSTFGSVPTKRFDRNYRHGSAPANFTAIRRETGNGAFSGEGVFSSGFVHNSADRNSGQVFGNNENMDLADNTGDVKPEKKRKLIFGRSKKRAERGKDRSRRKKVMKRAGIATLVVVLLAGLGLGYVYTKIRSIFKGGGTGAAALQENPDPKILNGEGDGRVNILIMGKGGPT